MPGTLRTASLASATAMALVALGPFDLPTSGAHDGAGPTGRISGRVYVGDPVKTRKPRFRLYTDYGPGSVPPPQIDSASPVRRVVVYLDSVPSESHAGHPSGTGQTMEQRNERFVPHVLPVLVGTPVGFPNRDPFFHNVFSLSGAKSFDLGRYAQNESRSVRFDKPGVVQVFCHIHSDMRAYIVVLDNPFFTVPDENGRFTLDGVPPGRYRLVGWQERAHPVTQMVTVEAGSTVVMDITIPDAPEAEH